MSEYLGDGFKYSVSNYDRCNLKIIQINGEELDRAGKAGNHINGQSFDQKY